MSMSDLAVHHGNPASLIAEWRERADRIEPPFKLTSLTAPEAEQLGRAIETRRLADELATILDGYALVLADDPCLDRTSDASKAHHAEHGRYLTVSESFDDVYLVTPSDGDRCLMIGDGKVEHHCSKFPDGQVTS